MLLQILIYTTFSSIFSLFGGLFLLLKKTWSERLSLLLTSFAAGVLLSTAFLDLFPEAIEHFSEYHAVEQVFLPAFVGIIFFFLLERTVFWFHHHHGSHGMKPTVWMVTIGDGVHNFIDGVAIAASFLSNPALGMITIFAVAAHEIPQEIADFSVLLSRGLSRSKAIIFNLTSALTSLIGAVCMYYFSQQLIGHLGSVIAFTAGMFTYISLSDLIPELHHSDSKKDTIPHVAMFLLGIILIWGMKIVVGEHGH